MSITKSQLLKLQYGSDIRGVACDIVADEPVTLTSEAAYLIGKAFALWLLKKKKIEPKDCIIGVGIDSRITGPEIKKQAIMGMLSTGIYVSDCGMAPTPAMFLSIVYPEVRYDGACMVTAGHLPFNHNGLRFFDGDGCLKTADITKILEIAAGEAKTLAPEALNEELPADNPRFCEFEMSELYAANLCMNICDELDDGDYDEPLEGLKIVVDAGNGAGGFFAQDVLEELGADTSGSCFLEPDGMFPNHAPDPESEDAMRAIRKATAENKADLGLIFDADADRMSAVLADGTPLNRDAVIDILTSEDSGRSGRKEYSYPDEGAGLAVRLIIAVAKAIKEGRALTP